MGVRTKEMSEKYLRAIQDGHLSKGCNLCNAPSIKDFQYWRIVDNMFPWDVIAKTQHMIIPKRHITYKELTDDEKKEFDVIKFADMENYDLSAEARTKNKSIPNHFHIHLIVLKD
jgi:hypothetical protein